MVATLQLSSSHYTKEEIKQLHKNTIPHHIAIIPDGNGRWAQQQDLPRVMGHWKGAEIVSTIIEAAKELGIKVLTFYSFSTENWTRPQEEIDTLMTIFASFLETNEERMIEQGVRFETIGDLSPLPQALRELISRIKKRTEINSKIDLVLAINYGSRDEITRATKDIVKKAISGEIDPGELTEDMIASHLDTAQWKDPELLIRTSGELRTSNFLLWQLSYAEIYAPSVLWPEFTPRDFFYALEQYQYRQRRFGGVK